MMVSGTMVERWLWSAAQDMNENNRTEILCLCGRRKGGVCLDPYEDGHSMAHLLTTGFMDGYTWWIVEGDEDDDDDDEDADGVGNDVTGQDEEEVSNPWDIIPPHANFIGVPFVTRLTSTMVDRHDMVCYTYKCKLIV